MVVQHVTKALLVALTRAVYRPTVEGRENVPRTGPAIFAANHLSAVDSFLIPILAPRLVPFIAKAEYYELPGLDGYLVRKALTALGTVPVPRGEFRAAQAALDSALAVLKDGKAFGIHPEGSRSRDGRLYRGRVGVAWLALASGAPVVPVGLVGTEKMMPVGGWLPRRVPVTLRFGKPMYFDTPTGPLGKARRDITDEVMAAIRDLSGQEMADEFNELSGNAR
jgi:1-acyl-sn-glycerol-3-phosphate acyltransferase